MTPPMFCRRNADSDRITQKPVNNPFQTLLAIFTGYKTQILLAIFTGYKLVALLRSLHIYPV